MTEDTEFAVVDVETTGLFPKGNDRIIEIAVIRIGPDGAVLGEYSSLVNPNRDLGASHLHGISAREATSAPTFEEIAGDVLAHLSGAVFVAHNASFDSRFVRAEMERIDCVLPDFPCLCTLQLSRRADPDVSSRQLGELCKCFDIPLESAHSALNDARAAASLFTSCVSRLGGWGQASLADLGVHGEPVLKSSWPQLPGLGRSYPREQAAHEIAEAPSFIARLVSRLPSSGSADAEVDEYFALLDRVLEDRRVTSDEIEALRLMSEELGLSHSQAVTAHHEYMRDLIHVALEDDVITEAETADLEDVRKLLDVSEAEFGALVAAAKCDRERGDGPAARRTATQEDIRGKSICFTGTFACRIGGELTTRSHAEEVATERGMLVKKGVTKKLDFLVAADPDSMSGKAKKARQHGVRIIAEPVFWRMVGIDFE